MTYPGVPGINLHFPPRAAIGEGPHTFYGMDNMSHKIDEKIYPIGLVSELTVPEASTENACSSKVQAQ